MRCSCCNKALSDYESTLKHAYRDEYIDTCLVCLEGSNIPFVGRKDLEPEGQAEEEDPPWDENDDDIPF